MYWASHSGVAHSLTLAAAVGGLVVITSCTPTAPVTRTPSVEASPTQGSDITPVNAALAQTLECAGAIGTGATLADLAPNRIAGDVMAITGGAPGSVTDPIQWGGGASYEGFQFAKVGIAIKTGVKFNIIVPPTWRNQMRIGWGNKQRVYVGHHAAGAWMLLHGRRCRVACLPWRLPYATWMPYASRVGANCHPIKSLRASSPNVNKKLKTNVRVFALK